MNKRERLQKVISLKADNAEMFERMMEWEGGSTLAEPTDSMLKDVLFKFKDISARWLLFGEGFIFGSPADGIVQKLTFLVNLQRYVPVMTEEEKIRYEDAIMVRDYTSYALDRWNEWDKRLENVKSR